MEKMLFFAAPAVFGVALFIFIAFKTTNSGNATAKKIIFTTAGIAAALFAFFVYVYSFKMADINILRFGLPFLCGVILMILYGFRFDKQEEYAFVAAAAVIFLCALPIFYPGIIISAVCFATVDIFPLIFKTSDSKRTENRRIDFISEKAIYFVIAAVFMMLFLADNVSIKAHRFAFNGFIAMLILSSLQSFYTLSEASFNELKHPYFAANTAINLISGIGQFVIIAYLIQSNYDFILIRFISVFIIFLFLAASYKSITEEKYTSFVIRQMHVLLYLGVFAVLLSNESQKLIAIYTGMLVVFSFFSVEFMISKEAAKTTMSALKYSFEKVTDKTYAMISLLTAIIAEIYLMLFISKNMKSDQFLQAFVILSCVLYAPVFLNKIFALFSMIKRIKFENKEKKIFNNSIVFGVLILSVVIAMLLRW